MSPLQRIGWLLLVGMLVACQPEKPPAAPASVAAQVPMWRPAASMPISGARTLPRRSNPWHQHASYGGAEDEPAPVLAQRGAPDIAGVRPLRPPD